ncbi:MAG: hypothetical protein GXO70_07380 [Acidobacteria bacterium]|nr:hypothetical protein [Acidobacteriota bacterium]
MRRLRILPFLVVIALLCSIVQAAFHHHKDGKVHPECQICLFQQATANGDAGSVQILTLTPPDFALPDYILPEFEGSILFFPTLSRSPPHLS